MLGTPPPSPTNAKDLKSRAFALGDLSSSIKEGKHVLDSAPCQVSILNATKPADMQLAEDTSADTGKMAQAANEQHSAIAEVTRCAVEVKRLETTALVEIERMRQTGATERIRVVEESRSQRCTQLVAVAKQAVEEHHSTERQQILQNAETQRAAIAAKTRQAEISAAAAPRPLVSNWLLMWLFFGRGRRGTTGPPMFRVVAGLMLTRQLWTSAPTYVRTLLSSDTPTGLVLRKAWRTIVASLVRKLVTVSKNSSQDEDMSKPWSWLMKVPAMSVLQPPRTIEDPSSQDAASSVSRILAQTSQAKEAKPRDFKSMKEELSAWGLAEYTGTLDTLGYDMDVLADLKEPDEVAELLSAAKCKPGHCVRFREALKSWSRGDG